MNVVFHKPKLSKEHEKFTNIVEETIIKNKKEYCNRHGYQFIIDTTPNSDKHWNEDYWSHIPSIIKLFKKQPDIEWLFFVFSLATINDMDRPIFNLMKNYPDKKLLFGTIEFKMKKWFYIKNDRIYLSKELERHLHKLILSPCMFVKNCEESIYWLDKIYNDMRFNEDLFSEENGRTYDSFRGDGHQTIDQAFTIYFENYPEFRNITEMLVFGHTTDHCLGTIVLPQNEDKKSMRALFEWANLLEDSNTETLINPKLHIEHEKKNFLKFITCNMTPENIFI